MNVIAQSLGDPIWQIGGGIILLATLVLLLAVAAPRFTSRRGANGSGPASRGLSASHSSSC